MTGGFISRILWIIDELKIYLFCEYLVYNRRLYPFDTIIFGKHQILRCLHCFNKNFIFFLTLYTIDDFGKGEEDLMVLRSPTYDGFIT